MPRNKIKICTCVTVFLLVILILTSQEQMQHNFESPKTFTDFNDTGLRPD